MEKTYTIKDTDILRANDSTTSLRSFIEIMKNLMISRVHLIGLIKLYLIQTNKQLKILQTSL